MEWPLMKGFFLVMACSIIRVFCPRAGLSLQTQAPRLQFCPKAGLPSHTQEPTLQFYYLNMCGSFPLLSAPQTHFSICTDLKRSENIPGAPAWRWAQWIWLSGLSGLHQSWPHGFNISSIRVFDQIRDPETSITLRPMLFNWKRKILSWTGAWTWISSFTC